MSDEHRKDKSELFFVCDEVRIAFFCFPWLSFALEKKQRKPMPIMYSRPTLTCSLTAADYSFSPAIAHLPRFQPFDCPASQHSSVEHVINAIFAPTLQIRVIRECSLFLLYVGDQMTG